MGDYSITKFSAIKKEQEGEREEGHQLVGNITVFTASSATPTPPVNSLCFRFLFNRRQQFFISFSFQSTSTFLVLVFYSTESHFLFKLSRGCGGGMLATRRKREEAGVSIGGWEDKQNVTLAKQNSKTGEAGGKERWTTEESWTDGGQEIVWHPLSEQRRVVEFEVEWGNREGYRVRVELKVNDRKGGKYDSVSTRVERWRIIEGRGMGDTKMGMVIGCRETN